MARNALIVIPARYGSSRFPGKPLAMIAGMSMIERVWRLASASRIAEKAVIATDDIRLKEFAEGFGAEVFMTSESCRTGTDRVAEVATELADYEIYFNLQGDAVLTPPWVIDSVLEVIIDNNNINMATASYRLEGEVLADFVKKKEEGSTTGTMVVSSLSGDALYFSRSLIPCWRDETPQVLHRHIGLYAYTKDTLKLMASLSETPLEGAEKLEQLRALENGISIRVVEVDYRGHTPASVDCSEDVTVVEAIIRREGEIL